MLRKAGEKKLRNYYEDGAATEVNTSLAVKDGVLPSFKSDWEDIKKKMVYTGLKHGDFEIVLLPLTTNGYICNFPFEIDEKGEKKLYNQKHNKAKKNVFGCCSPDKINLFRASFIGNFYAKQFTVIDVFAFMKEFEFIVNGEMLIDRIRLYDFFKSFLEQVTMDRHKAEGENVFLDHFKGSESTVEEIPTVIPQSPPAPPFHKFAYEEEMEAAEEARKKKEEEDRKIAEDEAYFMSLTCSLQQDRPILSPLDNTPPPPPSMEVEVENNNVPVVDKIIEVLPLKDIEMSSSTTSTNGKTTTATTSTKKKEKEKEPATTEKEKVDKVTPDPTKDNFFDLIKYVLCCTSEQLDPRDILNKDFLSDVEEDISPEDLKMMKALKSHGAKFNIPVVKNILKKKNNGAQLALWMDLNGV